VKAWAWKTAELWGVVWANARPLGAYLAPATNGAQVIGMVGLKLGSTPREWFRVRHPSQSGEEIARWRGWLLEGEVKKQGGQAVVISLPKRHRRRRREGGDQVAVEIAQGPHEENRPDKYTGKNMGGFMLTCEPGEKEGTKGGHTTSA